ncbi:partial Collagenase ColH, partial [Thermoflexales bacterium]
SSPTLINVTFSSNAAIYGGGGMYNFLDSSPTLTNVTFSGNAAASGGGMYNNSNSSPQVRNTLLWGDSGSEIYNASNSMPTISDSVVQGGCPSGSTCTNVIAADPRLASFGNYGGSTRTFALLPGSAAIHATSANCPLTDQRGVARDSTCDIGAFESQGFTLGSLTGTPQSTIRNTAFAQPLGLSVTSAFSEPIAGGIISFIAPVSGASLAQVAPFTKTIDANGAVSATVTANGLTGSYTVTASAGGGTSANFALTNLGQTLYARSDGATSGACATWADACTLQYALTQATARDEIWVGKGVYKPTTSTTDRTATFQLVSGVAVYGGFALTETLHTQRDPTANVVVLSGDIDNNDMVDAQGVVTTSVNLTGTNSYHVVWGANGATLDGVTITAGNTQGGYPNVYGGGMYNSSSSPTLINVTFSGNAATFGGGMCNGGGSSPTLISVTFSGNAATYSGGGMYNESSSPTLSNVTFSGNMATDINGGGMYNVSSSPTLSNVTFNSNSAPNGYGGGMFNYQSSPTLTNVTFGGNTAVQWGGGMYNGGSSSPTLTNVTFSGNVAPNGRGGGMVNWDYSNPQVRNALLWGDSGGEMVNVNGTPTVSNSVVQGGCPSDSTCTNVISADPLLAPLGNYTCPGGQCQGGGSTPTMALLPGSAAIAATSTNCPLTDQRGVARDSTCDIGAFESQGFTLGTLTGTPQSASVNTAFAQPLGLSVTSAFGEPVAGGLISFTAHPAVNGASFAEVTPFTKTIGASGAVSATVTANGLTGSYTVTASASGATSVNFALTNKLATTTTLTSAPNPSVLGQTVTFTATVTSSGGTPTGSITFTIDSTNLTVPLGANGQAVYVTQTLSLGNHPVSAAYNGDANFNVSSGVLSGGQTVDDVAVTGLISINSSPTRLTDVTYFTATVATGSNLTYQWNFGDGQTASGTLSSHTYAATGNYTALVTATNGAGSVSTATPVTITNQRPAANAGADQSVLVNAVVTLAGSGSTDPDGHLPLTYRWAQSGGPSVTFTPNVSATSFTAPSAPAVLTFTLNVTDAQGLPNLTGESIVITVGDVAIANLTAANDSPMKIGHLTHFTATLSAGSNVIYTWDFGNGQIDSGAFSSHMYAVAGNYTATVTATNNLGSVSASTLVTIEPVRLYLPLVLK